MTVFSGIVRFLKQHIFRHIHAFVVLILVTVLCMVSLSYRYFIREDAISPAMIAGSVIVPLQEGVNGVGRFLFKTEEERKSLSESRKMVNELTKENQTLKRENEELSAIRIENEELRALLSAKQRLGDYRVLEATVIGSDGVNCFRRFTINRGTLDGVRINMNIINEDGLIGVVTQVGLNYAVVTSIIEDGMSVSAMTKNGHENCIVTGDLTRSGDDELLLSEVLASVDIMKDTALVTSNISDRFLPNLLIGYVTSCENDPGDLTMSGTVSAAVDFSRIKEVLVILDQKEKLQETEAAK